MYVARQIGVVATLHRDPMNTLCVIWPPRRILPSARVGRQRVLLSQSKRLNAGPVPLRNGRHYQEDLIGRLKSRRRPDSFKVCLRCMQDSCDYSAMALDAPRWTGLSTDLADGVVRSSDAWYAPLRCQGGSWPQKRFHSAVDSATLIGSAGRGRRCCQFRMR